MKLSGAARVAACRREAQCECSAFVAAHRPCSGLLFSTPVGCVITNEKE
jgi:hypothetical protein